MSYNELYSRVACTSDAKNVLDFASNQTRREAQVGYSTSARSLGISTPTVKDKKIGDSQSSFSNKSNFQQRTHRCIRAHCGNEGTRLVAKTEISFLIQFLGNEIVPDDEIEMRLCPNHYREFRDANIKNLNASRKYDLLTPSMDPPSLYETEVHVREFDSMEAEPEETEQAKRNEIPIDPEHTAAIVSNVVRVPKDTLLDRIYHWLRRCCYGDPSDPCQSETSNPLPKLRDFSLQQPLIWSLPQNISLHPVQPNTPMDQYQMPIQSPTSTSKQRDPVIVQSRNVFSPNLSREAAPLQHSLATSGINRRFGGGQNSEYQSSLFRSG